MAREKPNVDQIAIAILKDQITRFKRDERIMKLLIKQQVKTIRKLNMALNHK